MDKYVSWDDFCTQVFDRCGASGRYLRPLYGAGGIALLLAIVSMLGFSPFIFLTALLGFLITPLGMVVAAALGALAVPALKHLFSERRTLQPVLKRLAEAKAPYDKIVDSYPDPLSIERRSRIDSLFDWVMEGGSWPGLE